MEISVNIQTNMSGVPAKVRALKNNNGLGLALANEALVGMDKYVPFRDGWLANSAVAQPFKVTYSMPYAKAMYYGVGKGGSTIHYSKQGHPIATSYWADAFASAGGAEQVAAAGTAYLKG